VALLAFTIAAWGMPSSASELRRATVASAALGRDMRFIVYIPDGYETGAQRYPVLYLLHGAGGDENAWVERGYKPTILTISQNSRPPAYPIDARVELRAFRDERAHEGQAVHAAGALWRRVVAAGDAGLAYP